jgi:hypothetical protein
MNNELRKNAEGYTDPTAAATLNRKEAGDIWEYKSGECLILKAHTGFATILRLHDSNQYGDRIKVAERDDGPRYVDPAFVITGRFSEMGKYVETLDVVTFGRVLNIVADTMGLDVPELPGEETTDTQEADKLRDIIAGLQVELESMQDLAAVKHRAAEAARAGELKAKNQLELLRDMYNELLAKVMGGMVNDAP